MIDAQDVKEAARGRWLEVLTAVGGFDPDLLDGKHHPCPRCGGRDRFRLLDRNCGAVICNQCFAKQNGDGLSAIRWFQDSTFDRVVSAVGHYLGVSGRKETIDIVATVARIKGVAPDALKAFGAAPAKRGDRDVCRFPMWGENGLQCSSYDLDKSGGKGYYQKDMPVGLFWAKPPDKGSKIFIVEGVKDAAALHATGRQTIGLPTRAMHDRFIRLFAKCEVVVIADRDVDGERGAEQTASRLAGHAKSVALVRLPGELKKSDGDGVREVLKQERGLATLEAAIHSATVEHGSSEEQTTLSAACVQYLDELRSGKRTTLPTGIESLDASFGGAAPGEVIVVGARPGHCKTAFALQWLQYLAHFEQPALMISEEMKPTLLGRRALQGFSVAQNESQWKNNPEIAESEISEHFEKGASVYVVHGVRTARRACESIDEHVRDHGIKIAAVDYVQFLQGEGRGRSDQVASASVELARCARRNDIILVVLCQLSRAIETRTPPEPLLSDLRESGQLEQDADVVLFLLWPWRMNSDYKNESEFRIYVAKSRSRPIYTPRVICQFDPARQRIC